MSGSQQLLLGGKAVEAIPVNYIEDVFSTWLYTGTGAAQTITNGVDLAGKGGLFWLKERSSAAYGHILFDTARSTVSGDPFLQTNITAAQAGATTNYVDYLSDGLTLKLGASGINLSSTTYALWTFRKQPKFFDVVTYTGDGDNTFSKVISHNLGAAPGAIIVKATSATGDWCVWHRGQASTPYGTLNTTAAFSSSFNGVAGNPQDFTPSGSAATNFLVSGTNTNAAGVTYVAYLFAHDAGGFGPTGTDNVITCGSFTTNASGYAAVDLGYEPQWVLTKTSNAAQSWYVQDNIRGHFVRPSNTPYLTANSAGAEVNISASLTYPTSTGFVFDQNDAAFNSKTFIYIAIRRGPMKVPTDGTKVLGITARTGTGVSTTVTGGPDVTDFAIIKNRFSALNTIFVPRLTANKYLVPTSTGAEVTPGVVELPNNPWDVMNGVRVGSSSTLTNASGNSFINYLFRRAPGFMDIVLYTGSGSAATVAHGLKAVPELIIVKGRTNIGSFPVYSAALGATRNLILNGTNAPSTNAFMWNNTEPTSSVFSVGGQSATSGAGQNYIAYLFATCPGVSKIGTYTGNQGTQTIDCGFTSGARFVMIKRSNSTSDWYIWDSTRGIVTANDPHWSVNGATAEVGTNDSIDVASTGFVVNQVSATNINVVGGTYIYLAIA